MARHPVHLLMAEFETEDDAVDALHDLERLPLDGHLRCEVHHRDDHVQLVQAEQHLLQRVGLSMVFGAPVGVLLALAAMLAWSATDSTVSKGLILGVGIAAGSIFGILIGGIVGIAWGSREIEEAGSWERRHLCDHEVLVAVVDDDVLDATVPDLHDARPTALPLEIRRIFAEHHGRETLLTV